LGIEAIVEAVDLIKIGKAPKIYQDDALATYEPPCDDTVAAVDWSKPASDVYNLVRGCDPQPGAFLMFKGGKVRLYKARLIESKHDQTPGEILDISEAEIMVALNGGMLGIGKVRDSAGAKMDANEFAARADLKVGMSFGS
jgi:methionyl-tRNA formyltransferase